MGFPIGLMLALVGLLPFAWLIGVALNIPMYIDGTQQANGVWASTNSRRLATGICAGIGQGLLSVYLFHLLQGV